MADDIKTVCAQCGGLNRIAAGRLEQAGEARCGRCHAPLIPGKAQTVSAERFDAFIGKSDLPVLVDFWAPWCGPCLALAPTLERVAGVLAPEIRVAKLNIDEAPQIASRRRVQAVPTLAVFRRGRELARTSGARSERELTAWARAAATG